MKIRNIFLLPILLLLIVTQGYSQQRFEGGLILGITGSQIDGDTQKGYRKAGATAGMYVLARFSEKWGLQSGAQYIGKGSKKNADPDAGDFSSFRTQLDYIEMPFLLTYSLQNRFRLQAGIGYDILLRAYRELDGYRQPEDEYDFKKTDIVSILSLKYYIHAHWGLESRFCYSIRPVAISPAQYNNNVAIGLLYQF